VDLGVICYFNRLLEFVPGLTPQARSVEDKRKASLLAESPREVTNIPCENMNGRPEMALGLANRTEAKLGEAQESMNQTLLFGRG
jgi:hypothetical protein